MRDEERIKYSRESLFEFETPSETYKFVKSFLAKNYFIPIIQSNKEEIITPARVILLPPKERKDELTVANYLEGLRRIAYDGVYEGEKREQWGLEDFIGSVYIFNDELIEEKENKIVFSVEVGLNRGVPRVSESFHYLNVYMTQTNKSKPVYCAESDFFEDPIRKIMNEHLGPSFECNLFGKEEDSDEEDNEGIEGIIIRDCLN
jgi:hypothetical protein